MKKPAATIQSKAVWEEILGHLLTEQRGGGMGGRPGSEHSVGAIPSSY
ncbi:hypothetical protein P0D69_31510 [Paraburkholderia sediminicola]